MGKDCWEFSNCSENRYKFLKSEWIKVDNRYDKRIPTVSGTYIIASCGSQIDLPKILYVGASKNLKQRLGGNHLIRDFWLRYEWADCYFKVEKVWNRALEDFLIREAQPEYNISGKKI